LGISSDDLGGGQLTVLRKPVLAGQPRVERRVSATITDETFDAVLFDWDGTAVPDRHADATSIRQRVEMLCALGVHVFVASGTHLANIDGQFRARPPGRGRLHLCLNRGSEVFEVGADGPVLVQRRSATKEEDVSLDRAAELTVRLLRARGIQAQVVSQRLNRRKIDLIPESAWADPPKAQIAELAEAVAARLHSSGIESLAEVVALTDDAARSAGLSDPRITSDVKHVEIGLTDKSDSARFVARWLAERGITGGLVLIGGDEFGPIGRVPGSDSLMLIDEFARAAVVSVGVEPGDVPRGVVHLAGGPTRFSELLDTQLARRADRQVPQIDLDPAWVLALPTTRSEEQAAETLATLATLGNGWAGTRGSKEEDGSSSPPMFVVGGIYTDGGTGLLPGPLWTDTEFRRPRGRHPSEHRLLDLRTGTLVRFGESGSTLRSMQFVSGASPYALALRAEGPASRLQPGDALRKPPNAKGFEHEQRGDTHVARSGYPPGGGIVVAAREAWARTAGHRRTVERLAAWVANPREVPGFDEALERLAQIQSVGFDALLAEHREAWARRWADAEVVIEGSPEDEFAARFSVFHLLSNTADNEEAAVGARGLSGNAYGGHVFWDTDVFVLPALVAIRPAAARAMLEYRIRRLPAARAAAEAQGLKGARFPWESAADGSDVTPRWIRGKQGQLIPIRTGQREEHVVADVAWAAARYATWTGDRSFVTGVGRDLLVDTARYWSSRIRMDAEGRGHLYGVIGPDEDHAVVDDNAFTNVMARWNLRQGAELLSEAGDNKEAERWRGLADALIDGWNPERGIYEQFAGYFDLEPLLVSQVAQPPTVGINVLLGAERVAGSQIIKQADVLMLHHLVPEEVMPGSLAPCLAFYEPRTAHGSSLSPAIHASLLARVGEPQRALELFRLAARLDLDDVTGTTAGGLHLGAMGGTWQALAYGFLGLRADADILEIDPCLPEEWQALGLRFCFLGCPLGVRAERDSVTIRCDTPLVVRVGRGMPERCNPPGRTFTIESLSNKRSNPSAQSSPRSTRRLRPDPCSRPRFGSAS